MEEEEEIRTAYDLFFPHYVIYLRGVFSGSSPRFVLFRSNLGSFSFEGWALHVSLFLKDLCVLRSSRLSAFYPVLLKISFALYPVIIGHIWSAWDSNLWGLNSL